MTVDSRVETNTASAQTLTTLFNVSAEKNAITHWQRNVIAAIQRFLSQVKEHVIQGQGLTLASLMISYVPEAEGGVSIENTAKVFKYCLSGLGVSVSLISLTTAEALSAHQKNHDVHMILCTPAYAQRIAKEPAIRVMIDEFGKTRNDSLHTFLCAGGFGDTALKVVDGHYLIRSYQGALKLEASLTSLQTFVDVILNVSGNGGLGFLPDLLDLEKMERAKARGAYIALFSKLSNALQALTNQYRLTQDVELKTAQNFLREYVLSGDSVSPMLSKTLTKPVVKTGLFMCPTKGDTLLTGLHVEQQLLSEGKLLLSIDCQDYAPQKLAGQSVRLALQRLGFKRPDMEALKHQPLVILFKNYEQLGAYDNLYVKNQLRQWPNVKVVVTCRADFFQHRDYQSCFLSDPANPQMDSLLVHTMLHFAPQEAEALALSSLSQSQIADTLQDEAALSPKTQAIQTEVSLFLQNLYKILVEEGTLKPVLSQNPQAFISYAWEADKASLVRQQRHLAKMAKDLGTLGIPTWLDIERMTGDIDEQMAGNIKDSTYALVIGTPRYTQRAEQPTNVKKEYLAIVAKEKQGDLKVFPLQFLGDNAFPSEFINHPNGLDFRQIDDEAVYTQQLTALIPKLVKIDEATYQKELNSLHKALELLPATHLITNKNQDEIQSYDIDNRLTAYVKPHALSKADDPLDTRFDLPKHFNEHLAKDNTKAYVTLGRSGSGKSLFTLFTFKQLLQQWHQWRTAEKNEITRPEWLPIYIPLKNYANEKADQAIELALKAYQLDADDIQNLKQGLGVGQKVLFILDGYDELGKGIRPNYAEQLKDWPHAKLLISGRPEHFDSEAQHKDAFALNQDYNTFKVIHVSPFSPEEIKEYIVAFDTNPDTYTKIESIPGLLPLLDNPFLLNLVLQALPRLLETHHQASHQAIKRCDIYQAFIDTLFSKEAYKQQEIHGQTVSITEYHQFAQDLAFALFAEKTISITSDKTALWQKFSQAQSHIREACPLKRTGDEYSFLHKSVYEYFVAIHLWNALKENPEVLVSRWNTRALTEERAVIDFLVEFYQTNRFFASSAKGEKTYLQPKERLFQLVEASKQQANVAPAAANAITVLNSANVVFWSKDFRNIRISGADLQNAICDNTNLQNADLTNVQFQGASLSHVNFQGSQMQGVNFGELPYLPLNDLPNSCSYSKEGHLLAIAEGNIIQIYDARTYTILRTLEGHTGYVNSVMFNPQGQKLASGSDDRTIRLWNIYDGNISKILEGHKDEVKSVSFSPDGKLLASGGGNPYGEEDNTIRLWNVESGELQTKFKGHNGGILSLSFNPNGKQLASGSEDKTICLWDIKHRTLEKTLKGHTEEVKSISFSPNGKLLASGSYDKTIKLWNVKHGELKNTLKGHSYVVTSVIFNPNNSEQLASASSDCSIRLWNVQRGELEKILEGHTGSILNISFSPNGEQLISGDYDKIIRLWNIEPNRSQKKSKGHSYAITSVFFSPDGKYVLSGSRDKTIKLWDAKSGELKKTLEGHYDTVSSVSFSSNGKQLASGSYDRTVRLWNLEDGKLQKILEGHSDTVSSISFSSNGKQLASGSYDRTVRLWNLEDGKLQKILEGHKYSVNSVSFSPDGTLLVSGGDDKTICLWDVVQGVLQKTLEGHTDNVRSVKFSPNGKKLISASDDKTIQLWNISQSRLEKTLEGHSNNVVDISFGANGAQLISCSHDNTVRLWSCNTQYASLNTFSSVNSIAWYEILETEEAYLATGHEDTSIRYWRVTQLKNTPHFELLWNSNRSTKLILANANIEGVQGLSQINAELLTQRGAQGRPNKAAEQGNKEAQVTLDALTEQEKIKAMGISSELPIVSTTTGLSAVGFFAQSQKQPIDAEEKIKAEKAEPELVKP